MSLLFRKVVKIGPLRLHFGRTGLTSWSLRFGRWSWNSKTRAHRVDLPGPWSWRGRR